MAWTPISNTVPQYEEDGVAASGFYIKFYEAGTTTPTAMATDSTGATTLDKCELNTEGYPKNGSNAVFIPHINKQYKIVLFRNATDADNNNLNNAAWLVDSLPPVLTGMTGGALDEIPLNSDLRADTITDLRLQEPTTEGQQISLLVGDGVFYYDSLDTDTPDDSVFTIVTAGGRRWKRTGPHTPVAATWYLPAGDGVTDDKAIIDSLNVVLQVVDLAGLTYYYDGDFTQKATFINGVIISSSFGTYEYTNNVITEPRTITVGASGTFKRLDAAFDYLRSQVINSAVTLSILDKFGSKSASDPMSLDGYLFDHPQSFNVELSADLLSGDVPRNSDMTGVEATDESFALGRYSAAIYLHGNGISGTYGLAVPNGLRAIRRIMFVSATRYSIDIGFTGSHFASTNARGCIFEQFTVFGGVWGVIGKKANLAFNTDSFFAYQFSGGPIDSIGCTIRADNGHMNMFTTSGVKPSTGPQYAIFAEEKSTIYLPFNNVQTFEALGSFLHGIHISDNSYVSGTDMTFIGVTQPMTAVNNSIILADNPIISDADPVNTASVPGAAQGGYGNNIYQGCLFCAGSNSYIEINQGTVENCIGSYCGVAAAGKITVGYDAISINNCKFSVRIFTFDLSDTCLLDVNVTNPKAGSIDTALASAQSNIRVSTNTGITFSPPLDTVSNGNLFSSTG